MSINRLAPAFDENNVEAAITEADLSRVLRFINSYLLRFSFVHKFSNGQFAAGNWHLAAGDCIKQDYNVNQKFIFHSCLLHFEELIFQTELVLASCQQRIASCLT